MGLTDRVGFARLKVMNNTNVKTEYFIFGASRDVSMFIGKESA